jgi:hypothetical protein
MFDIVDDMNNVFEQQRKQHQKNGYEYPECFISYKIHFFMFIDIMIIFLSFKDIRVSTINHFLSKYISPETIDG